LSVRHSHGCRWDCEQNFARRYGDCDAIECSTLARTSGQVDRGEIRRKFVRLSAGGRRIRTIGPAVDETAVEKRSAGNDRRLARRSRLHDPIQPIGPASLFGRAERTLSKSGTDGSNPVPSSGESTANPVGLAQVEWPVRRRRIGACDQLIPKASWQDGAALSLGCRAPFVRFRR